jgi:type IV pilus assembly protein PilP
MKFGSVALAIALLAPIGCGDEPVGPTKDDLAAERDAVKARIAKAGGRGKKQKKQQGARAADGHVPQAFAQIGRDYSYDSTGKRDPFRDFKWDRPDRMHAREIDGPLQQFDLGQLSLVAVVWKTGNARALVQDPSGENYIVAEGSRIGKNSGHVIAIHDSAMVVKETYMDFLGQETTKDIEMRLRRNEGG